MSQSDRPTLLRVAGVLLIGLVAVVLVLGAALLVTALSQAGTPTEVGELNALATSDDECVVCHRRTTPGIVSQYGRSAMAAAEVTCRSCHEVDPEYPGAEEHEGTYILASPTTAKCETCHSVEVAQFYQSRHSLPAYVAYAGAQDLPEDLLLMYESIPEGGYSPDRSRNALYRIEGEAITRFACESCHNIGRPAEDGSVGQCQKCHLRHEFSLEQARRPETCNACHIGPDHPQWEIYQESPHGIAYMVHGDNWSWEAEAGTLTVEDFPAPTCATCHMSGFGSAGTTHDVGDRLTWFLFAPVSERRPSWQDNLVRMQSVCQECHNVEFVEDFFEAADAATESVNEFVRQGMDILAEMRDAGLLTDEPFDQPIDFIYFNMWHHWGRTAKFGVWMQGPDYVQWHGIYELLDTLAEMREIAEDELAALETHTVEETGAGE